MSLAPDTAAQLGVYAQLAVGLAGFAGVIGAFSHFRIHAQATAFRVRAMVVLALMEALFSLLPQLIAAYGATEAQTWRIAAGLAAVLASAAVVVLFRQAGVLYRVGRLMRGAAYLLCVAAVGLILPLVATAAGFWPGYAAPSYFALMFFGVFVCSYHFVMLMVAVRLEENE